MLYEADQLEFQSVADQLELESVADPLELQSVADQLELELTEVVLLELDLESEVDR